MIATTFENTLICPNCHTLDPLHFFLQRNARWRESIREMFRDRGKLVLIAECDKPAVDLSGSSDELYCSNCGAVSTLDVSIHVHHEDPKV